MASAFPVLHGPGIVSVKPNRVQKPPALKSSSEPVVLFTSHSILLVHFKATGFAPPGCRSDSNPLRFSEARSDIGRDPSRSQWLSGAD